MSKSSQLHRRLLPTLLGLVLAGPVLAGEPKDPERLKQELLEIERRLDAKLELLDEKLKKLEHLEAAADKAPLPTGAAVREPVRSEEAPAKAEADAIADAQPEAPTAPEVDAGTVAATVAGADAEAAGESATLIARIKDRLPSTVSYGKNGFEFRTDNGLFSLAIQNRLQTRFASPFDSDPRSTADLERDQNSFMIRRARTKLRGHAYWPWLKYYFQYDWSQPILRDASLTVERFSWAKLWVGRGKVFYNDERVSSSGNQQFVNRSIVNDIMTVDRQQGVQIFGNLFPGTWHDVSYYAGLFTGVGVGDRNNDDDKLMYSGRVQWNALGGEMPFTQSDVEFHEKPALNFAFAGATNQSRCTAFETDSRSCRALPGFDVGADGQYQVDQMMEEVRFKWRGFSLQHEMHWKEVVDTLKDPSDPTRKTDLLGALVQAGFFPHVLVDMVPAGLELAGRYAFVDPDTDLGGDRQEEGSGVMTYYFNGHLNKVNFQVSQLTIASQAEQRYWLQWDFSF
ncbi:MAG: porin [Candidatus Binatia bacterium]